MTIAAIATPNMTGGIGIIRISGEKAVEIASELFFGKDVKTMESHKMHLGKIKVNNETVDNALVCVFKAPNSYTGEDVVEFHCHGGIAVCKTVLDAVYKRGAVPAGPGEFTKRAFLNGKMDLSQAEAVADLINAQTEKQVTVAASQLDKALSGEISTLRQKLIDATAHVMATMDYSEEGVEPMEYDELTDILKHCLNETEKLIRTSDNGRIISDGVNVAIVGSPNAGKSSLLNAILGEDRAIVTNIEGTTRDVLETAVNIRGLKLNLFDTAGIRESDDTIEQIGIKRSKETLEKADIVFFVVDGNKGMTAEETEIANMVDKKKTLLVINKSDLAQQKIDSHGYLGCVVVSAKNAEGFDGLYDLIYEKYVQIDIKEKAVVTNPRHKECLIRANTLIGEALNDIGAFAPFDIVLSSVELSISALGEIGGETVSEEIIDNIFSKFCVGK